MPQQQIQKNIKLLVCPQTKLGLRLCTIDEAEQHIDAKLQARPECRNSKGVLCKPLGPSKWVLLREDKACAYPVVENTPILLVPEMLKPAGFPHVVDLCAPQYAEAYDEMEYYNAEARREAGDIETSEAYDILKPVLKASEADKADFPVQKSIWVDAIYDCAAQYGAYRRLSPMPGKRVMQLGGKGIHAVKFLAAGAQEAWSVTPMLGEVLCGRALAKKAGVEARFHSIVAVAEELPFLPEIFDGVYAGGCLHHMQIHLAAAEIARILKRKGVFVAVEPWRAPLYSIGTRMFGKREAGAYCTPLTMERLASLALSFAESGVLHHGAITRYFLLALGKIGLKLELPAAFKITQYDDLISSKIPGLRNAGSSIVVYGVK